jgi:two-component system, cell cycle response regulator CtrA
MRALVVEGDPDSAKLIDAALKGEGIISEPAETGQDAIDLARHYDWDIMILDMTLPDMEGSEVIRRLRSAKIRTPVLILSDINETDDNVRGLATGVDDYLTKPFHKSELIARTHAIIRRSKKHSEYVIKTGKLAVNLDKRLAEVDGRRLHVTQKEYSILELLSLRKGATLTKEMFLDHLYGGIDEPALKIIDLFICKLRKKIAAATGGQHYIETVWGQGYALRDAADDIKQNRRFHDFSCYKNHSIEQILEELLGVIALQVGELFDISTKRGLSGHDVLAITALNDILLHLKAQMSRKNSLSEDTDLSRALVVAEYAYSMYSILHRLLQAEEHNKSNTVVAETTVAEGNLVRATKPAETDSWISETEFSSDAFNLMADFSRCLNFSKTPRQRTLCNLIFVLEVAKNAMGIFSQLIPLAGKKQ